MDLDFNPADLINSDSTGANLSLAGEGTPVVAETPGEPSHPVSEGGIDSGSIEAALARGVAQELAVTPEAETPAPSPVAAEQERKSAAQARIRQVISEKKALEAQLAQYQQQALQSAQAQADRQAEFQAKQLEMEQKRFAMLEARQRQEEEASLSETERARRGFLSEAALKAREELRRELMPELEALKAKDAARDQAEAQYRQQAEAAQRLNYFQQQAKQVLSNDLLKGFEPTEQTALGEKMEEMLYAYAGAYGLDPVKAAPEFKAFLSSYFKAEAKRVSRSAVSTVAKSQSTQAPLPQGRPGQGVQSTKPPLSVLRKYGINDYVEYNVRAAKGTLPFIPTT
jgi:hypothetical protein